MGRAVARKQDTAVAAPGFSANDFGSVTHDQELSSQDILIPKLLVMQPQSPKVVSGDCDLGDIAQVHTKIAQVKIKLLPAPQL